MAIGIHHDAAVGLAIDARTEAFYAKILFVPDLPASDGIGSRGKMAHDLLDTSDEALAKLVRCPFRAVRPGNGLIVDEAQNPDFSCRQPVHDLVIGRVADGVLSVILTDELDSDHIHLEAREIIGDLLGDLNSCWGKIGGS